MKIQRVSSFCGALVIAAALFAAGCASSASSRFYGKTVPPTENILRYVSGSEPESLDPQIGTGQPEARLYLALYDGLIEYDAQTSQPIPSLAERWQISPNGTEYTFFLRKNGRFSNGDPITAKDFVYTFRRGFDPETISRNAALGYYIKYAEAYNSGNSFLRKDGKFVLEADTAEKQAAPSVQTADDAKKDIEAPKTKAATGSEPDFVPTDTAFRQYINSPTRLILPSDVVQRANQVEKSAKIQQIMNWRGTEIKDGAALAKRLSNGDAAASVFARYADKNVIASCASGSCGEAEKNALADALNKAVTEEDLNNDAVKNGANLSESTKTTIAEIAKENDKRSAANKKLDAEIAAAPDETAKANLEKQRKKLLGKLYLINHLIAQDTFANEVAPLDIVPVAKEDIGVEAVDDYTFRITLSQPAPYFLGLLAHQFFRVLHEPTISKFGSQWTQPANIVTSGAFKLQEHLPYNRVFVTRDPMNWDTAKVKLDGIYFYPSEESTTTLNLYKAGEIDAFYNHTVPTAWIDEIRQYKDEYMDFPEIACEFYAINVTRPPMNDKRIREAFNLAFDREAYATYKRTAKPLYTFTPSGIFPEFDKAKREVASELAKEQNISLEQFDSRYKLNVPRACQLMREAGFKVTDTNDGKCRVENFPVERVNVNYNTQESNKATAEFVQAQWKQNLGITVSLKNMEFKTFLPFLKSLEYEGFGRKGWVGDYMDPFTFLELNYTAQGNGNTGWNDPKYNKMLDDANNTIDLNERSKMLARAEYYLLEQFIFLPISIPSTNWMKKPYVKGLYPNPATLHPWKEVYIERDAAKWDADLSESLKVDAAAPKTE